MFDLWLCEQAAASNTPWHKGWWAFLYYRPMTLERMNRVQMYFF